MLQSVHMVSVVIHMDDNDSNNNNSYTDKIVFAL